MKKKPKPRKPRPFRLRCESMRPEGTVFYDVFFALGSINNKDAKRMIKWLSSCIAWAEAKEGE